MIETKIAEISVPELMERVRAKAEEIRRLQGRPKLPAIAQISHPPRAVLPTAVVPKTQQITEATQNARRALAVSRWIPKPLRGLFRRQNRFNNDVLRSIESLVRTNAQLADRLRHLTACVEVHDQAIQHLADLRRADGAWMGDVANIIITANERLTEIRAAIQTDVDVRLGRQGIELGAAVARLGGVDRELHAFAATVTDLVGIRDSLAGIRDLAAGCRNDLDRAGEHLRQLQNQVELVKGSGTAFRIDFERAGEHVRNLQDEVGRTAALTAGCRGDLDRTGEHVRNLQGQVDQIGAEDNASRARLDLLTAEFRIIRDEFNRTGEHLRNLQSNFDRTAAKIQAPQLLEEAVARLEQRLTDDASYLKGELSQQRSLLANQLGSNGAKTRQRKTMNSLPSLNIPDAFYLSFEDRFRGSRAEIKRRQQYYLPMVRAAKAGSDRKPVIDVGCGRGEWLELLSEQGLRARGVDMNSTMVAHCAERHLDVVEADALAYLRRQKAASVGAVTGFHIIEHLPIEAMLELFAQAHRVLAPGGIAIFESPNCKNLLVGACNFNIDPTHRNPVYPETAEFMLGLQGFRKLQLHFLSPREGSPFTSNSPDSKFLDERLFGPQDFSVVGFKAVG